GAQVEPTPAPPVLAPVVPARPDPTDPATTLPGPPRADMNDEDTRSLISVLIELDTLDDHTRIDAHQSAP
ncbi:hypothetical protein SAMN05216561_12439, partial [Nocardioides psychrotolerans]